MKRLLLFFPLIVVLFSSSVFGASDFYWENPALFNQTQGRFPVSAYNGTLSVVAWQESESVPSSDGSLNSSLAIRISIAVKKSGGGWIIHRSIAGPYVFSGSEPSIISATVDKRNRILIATAVSPSETDVLLSEDEGVSFQPIRLNGGSDSSLAPRIFSRSDGGFLLFVTRGQDQSLTLFYSRSEDGKTWDPFQPFITEPNLRLNFLPTQVSLGSTEYVVFQSLSGEVRPTFQLFLKTSVDGGKTWTPAKMVTSFVDPFTTTRNGSENFDNQRPNLSVVGNSLFLVWERRAGVGSPQIYGLQLKEDGTLLGEVDRITNSGAYCNNPVGFSYQGIPTVLWYDNRKGANRIYLAQKQGLDWQDYDLSAGGAEALFARPVVDSDGLYVFWQTSRLGNDRIYLLAPDKSVQAPRLTALNFEPSVRIRQNSARIGWSIPDDSSGIAGYAYSWSQDIETVPPKKLMAYTSTTQITETATEDGFWYFSIIAQDYAGNWSTPSRIVFVRDTTAPPKPNIILPPLDSAGYLNSNTFTLQWNPPPASDLAGYTWSLDFVAPLESYSKLPYQDFIKTISASYTPKNPPPQNLGLGTEASFINRDNGVWCFTLSAVDTAGNIGLPSRVYFRTNKYVPYTYIAYVDSTRDEMGGLTLRILGRGFTEGGQISEVFLDRDGKPPYDREYLLNRGEYRILSDREIGGIKVEDLDEGVYRIGLVHPTRGLYLSSPQIRIDRTGTIKFGDYTSQWEPSWAKKTPRRFVFDTTVLLLGAMFILGALGLIASFRGIGSVITENAAIHLEAVALITGETMPSEKRERLKRLRSVKKRKGSLRVKLATFTIFIVLIVVVMVSVPLSIMMTRSQETTLLQGLQDRSRVLMESLASGARAYLPSQNVLELGFLPAQRAAIPEAGYTTITGFGSGNSIFNDYVWATNDPDILKKIDTPDIRPGVSRLKDVLTPRLEQIAKELNDQAKAEVGSLSQSIAALTQEGLSLALKTDSASVKRRNDIQATTRSLEARLNERLTALASNIGSEPAFHTDRLPADGNRTFIFFKPIMYRQGTEDLYFRGLIRLEVSIDSIVKEIDAGRQNLIKITGLIALIALAIGMIGSLLLATLIIRPLKKLVAHVDMIRESEDKAKLEGKDILIKSKDEIASLGDSINEMTHGLVKAALASQDLTIGKEIQKKFIPLKTDSMGNKLTIGKDDYKYAQFFGYYEGAKGVSGDYFDYKNLDGRYFAIIKCDVAGKGIPAALIMIQVATMFLGYFKGWNAFAKDAMNIERVVYQINDFIENLGFRGRFAAFTLCLFDSQTGLLRFCNAGDNLVHWYDAAEGELKTKTLPETPASGVLPNDLVDMKGGYRVQTLTINRGDILMLYTDGIEEAKRLFRDENFNEIVCSEGNAPQDTPHGNHTVGQAVEELGPDRVKAITESVMHRGQYELYKYHHSTPQEKFNFDFSSCEGKPEDVIMALVAVEKVFRMYKNPKDIEESRVLVDREVDKFLKEHFIQYKNYAQETTDHPSMKEYMYYIGVREDDQYDDLTLLGIKRL